MTIKDEIQHSKELAISAIRGAVGMLLLRLAMQILPPCFSGKR